MGDRKMLGIGVVVLSLAAAATVPSAQAAVKPEDPLTAFIGQCLWFNTAFGSFPGTLKADGDRFLKVDVPPPYVEDASVNPILVGWRSLIAIGAASPEACVETTTASFGATRQPPFRLDASGSR